MKSLKMVQTMAKVLKILFTILFVGCIVGTVFSVIALAITPLIANNQTLQRYVIKSGTEFELNSYISTCICSILSCGTWVYLGYKNVCFYKYELSVGTPFDKSVVTTLRKVAIEAIIISCVANIVEVIVCCILHSEVKDFGIGEIGTSIF